MGKRKKTHEYEDQYGGGAKPQDNEQFGFSKGSGGGGGAGKSKNSMSLNFERHVPKFLQPYAHLLGQKQQNEDEPLVVAAQQRLQEQEDDEDDDKAAEQEAMQRALEENPELAAQLDANFLNKMEAGKEKELGNKAFAAKDFETAIQHFTKCIQLDPKDAVYFSNRSAAYANCSKFDEALEDAQAVMRLKPGWVKGHARAAAAYMGLELYSEAKEAYEKAVKLEPDDQALQRAHDRAIGLELQHMRERKHVFKKARPAGGSSKHRKAGSSLGSQGASSKQQQKGKLSFAEDEEEEQQ